MTFEARRPIYADGREVGEYVISADDGISVYVTDPATSERLRHETVDFTLYPPIERVTLQVRPS